MTDIIHLLPDSVANQIAAGEVVQRPASAVKELMENTIDAGATEVKLVIREAGKSLIQVIDNGFGMSERDARMCFERHATSKITRAEDLLSIRTLGFRGEALASIASIAQVELRTRRPEDELGTKVTIDGSEFKEQVPVSCPAGTSVSVKNLFFNVPARRNFLKSNTLELKYIMEEFFRVALVHPGISFSFLNQDKPLFRLPAGNLRQRITNLFGNSYTQKLIPVEQQTALVNLSGFIGKPEFARKKRGEQYLFTNGRFMRSAYLLHAIETAFQELIPRESYPACFIYLEVDPNTIDVNIHPTKTEINFQDIRNIYSILYAAVRQSIGKFNLSPSLDFDTEQSMEIPPLTPQQVIRQPVIKVDPGFSPFEKKTHPQVEMPLAPKPAEKIRAWNEFYQPESAGLPGEQEPLFPEAATEKKRCFQFRNSYIVTHSMNNVLIIDQQYAHERILYERFIETPGDHPSTSQQLILPVNVSLTPDEFQLFKAWKDHFSLTGFIIDDFGKNSVLISAVPAAFRESDVAGFFESVLESLREYPADHQTGHHQQLARAMARKLAVRRGAKLQQEEMDEIIENLFACKAPENSPDGRPTMMVVTSEEIKRKFK